jgi:hypothetical protein
LPKSAAPVGRILDASAAKPQLGIEGDTIAATLKDGHVLITVVGPDVPSQGLSPPPPTTAATFTVTLKHPEGVVPIAAADFEILDGAGQIHEPQLVVGTTPAPATAPVGQTSSFQLTTVLATGPGTLRWAPEGSPIASWDFTVEVD